MGTIYETFSSNLKRLRGKRTQAEVAEAADIPLRSYQHAESGISIPNTTNLGAIARALRVHETALFRDPKQGPSPAEALGVLASFVEDTALSAAARDVLALLAALDKAKRPDLLERAREYLAELRDVAGEDVSKTPKKDKSAG